MKLSEIDEQTFTELDDACGAVLSELRAYCLINECEAVLTVRTCLEDLPKGEMKLYLQIVSDGDTVDYAVAKVRGSIQRIGWNIYLADTLESARSYVGRANERMAIVERAN